MIGHDEWVELDGLEQVRVVADDARHARLADDGQLLGREGRRLAAQFVPEAIAGAAVAELLRDDARKGGAQQTAGQGTLGHSSRPQIDIVRRSERKKIINGKN